MALNWTNEQVTLVLNNQVTHLMAMRGMITLLLAGEKVTEDAVWEVIAPFANPNADPATAANFKSEVLAIASDTLTAGMMRKARKSRR